MNNQAPPHKITDVASAIEDELSTFAISLIKRKPQAERDPSRINLAVVGGAAFLMLTLLDLISAVVVGSMTNILYGLLVFVIGVGALAIDEAGYFWAYSSKWQKITSGFDAFVGITSTLLVGMIAAGLYAVKKFGIADTSGWQSYIEIGTMVSLVLIGTTHAFLWIIWVLIDEGVKMMQTYNQGKAQNKTHRQTISLAESNMADSIAMANKLLGHVKNNKGGLLREELKNLAGYDMLEGVSTAKSNGNGNHP